MDLCHSLPLIVILQEKNKNILIKTTNIRKSLIHITVISFHTLQYLIAFSPYFRYIIYFCRSYQQIWDTVCAGFFVPARGSTLDDPLSWRYVTHGLCTVGRSRQIATGERNPQLLFTKYHQFRAAGSELITLFTTRLYNRKDSLF